MEKSIFDARAREWDTPGRIKLASAVAAAIRNNVDLKNSMTLLDFGAGTGLLSLDLLESVGKVIAIDESPEMLAVLREKASGGKPVETREGDYRQGALAGLEVDGIVSSMVLHHVEDTAGLLTSFFSILRPGGFIALADLEAEGGTFHSDNTGVHHFGFRPEELEDHLEGAGFSCITFTGAAEVPRTREDGSIETYPVFLVTAYR